MHEDQLALRSASAAERALRLLVERDTVVACPIPGGCLIDRLTHTHDRTQRLMRHYAMPRTERQGVLHPGRRAFGPGILRRNRYLGDALIGTQFFGPNRARVFDRHL